MIEPVFNLRKYIFYAIIVYIPLLVLTFIIPIKNGDELLGMVMTYILSFFYVSVLAFLDDNWEPKQVVIYIPRIGYVDMMSLAMDILLAIVFILIIIHHIFFS
ncbi:MAG: hypothetical protein GXO43_06110 [Crenarchaeota archaeon]|nr:hypothetical protein [Thermoproteota archaeon]